MRFKARIAAALVIGGMGLLIFVQALVIGLPMLAEGLIKSRLPDLPPGFDSQFKVESIGTGHIRIRAVSLGKDVRADSLEILYSWGGQTLLDVKKIRISGLVIAAALDKEFHVRVNNADLTGQSAGSAPMNFSGIQDRLMDLAAFIPKQVVLDHASLVINHKADTLTVPFYCRTLLSPETGSVKAHAVVSPLGQPLEMTVEAGIRDGLTAFTLDSRDLSPACFAGKAFSEDMPLTLTGPVDLHGEMSNTGLWQFRMSNLGVQGPDLPRVAIGTASGRFNPKTLTLEMSSDFKLFDLFTSPLPLSLKLKGRMDPVAPFSLSITATRPPEQLSVGPKIAAALSPGLDHLTISDPGLSLVMDGNRKEQRLAVQLSGKKVTAVTAPSKSQFRIFGPVLTADSRGTFLSGKPAPKIFWNLKADKAEGKALGVVGGAGKVTAFGQFRINPESLSMIDQAKVTGRISQVSGHSGDQAVSVKDIRFSAELAGKVNHQTIAMSGVLEPVSVSWGTRKGTAARAGWSGKIIMRPKTPVQFDVTPWIAAGRLTLPDEDLTAKGIAFKTRMTHPFIQGSSGQLSIEAITFENRLSAKFTSNLEQVDTLTYGLSGTLASADLTNKTLDIFVKAGMHPDLWAQCHAQIRHFLIADHNIRKTLPGIRLAGQVDLDTTADVWASYQYGNFSSRAALKIHGGSVNLPESKLAVQGITGVLNIRDFARMESYPGQLLNIDTISMGQFNFNNASLRFRIEDPKTLGIENLRFNWCKGLVSSEATQLPPADGGPFRLILFCDRLEMADLLNQMGAFDARGGGTLSGRIPVTYSNGNLSFDNGFLFSTPGQGGNVGVRDLNRFMAGFPKGTPESSYLEMAGEALKDFQYNWATLKMNSQGDTLTVNMELDGKPSRILPFKFQKETHAFVRVDAKSPGANFQGIKLDLNLTLPFNEVAKFGTKIKGLMD